MAINGYITGGNSLSEMRQTVCNLKPLFASDEERVALKQRRYIAIFDLTNRERNSSSRSDVRYVKITLKTIRSPLLVYLPP
jgi:hypothetical protein